MHKTTLLICALALVVARQTFHPEVSSTDRLGLCALNHGITSSSAKTISTFYKNGNDAAAAKKLCDQMTNKALKLQRGDNVDCNTRTVNQKAYVDMTITVQSMMTTYECAFFVNNTADCTAEHSSSSDRKRQMSTQDFSGDPCNLRTSESECTSECIDGSPLSNNCLCYWDDPTNPSGFPMDTSNGANSSCTPQTPCCWNRACSTYGTESDCDLGGGGTDTEPDRCVFVNNECTCTTPLITVPLPMFPPTEPLYAPFDCLCPVDGAANTSSVAQCAALLTPTKEQKRQVQRLDFRVAATIGAFNRDQFLQKCKVEKVCVTPPSGHGHKRGGPFDWIAGVIGKVLRQLSQSHCDTDVQSDPSRVCLVTVPGCGSAVQNAFNKVLTEDQLQQIEPIVVEAVDPSTAALVTLSTALIAALAAVRLL